jgi:CheY-like chemotaxis protein
MNEFTTLLVAKTDSSLVKILKSRYLVHANEAVVAFSLTIRPELILIDCDTCGADPFLLCRELRTHPELETTCVVLLSKILNRPCDRAHAQRCGASELLSLDSDLDQLRATLFSIMNQARRSLPLMGSEFHLLEAKYHKECHSYLLAECNQWMEEATTMRTEAKQVAQLQSRLEAKQNHAERQESVANVSAAIAHDFRIILAEFIGFAESGIHLSDAPSNCVKQFDSILKCSRRASSLVDSILDNSRQKERLPVPFDLTEGISETLETLRASVPPSVQLTENEAVPKGKGERILFVDDEEVLGLVISESLSSLGYQATFAPTPEVALVKHRTERFDVVITDLSMPRMNGMELARSLWNTKPQQRVILTTGHAGKLTPEAVYALGFSGLLLKPFKTASLANLLQKALT